MPAPRRWPQKNIDAANAAGQKPTAQPEIMLVIAGEAEGRSRRRKDAGDTGRQLTTTPEDWKQMMDVALTTKGMRDIDSDLSGPADVPAGRPAQPGGRLADRRDRQPGSVFYGDAVQAERHGGTGFPHPRPGRRRQEDHCGSRSPPAPSRTAMYNVKLAEALYGYGMYPEAEACGQARQDQGRRHGSHRAPTWCSACRRPRRANMPTPSPDVRAINQRNPASARIVRLWIYFGQHQEEPPDPGTGATAAAEIS